MQVCNYQDLHLVEAGQLSHVSERLEQVLEEGGGHGDQVLVGLVLLLVDAEQRDHSVCTAMTPQDLQTRKTCTPLPVYYIFTIYLFFPE